MKKTRLVYLLGLLVVFITSCGDDTEFTLDSPDGRLVVRIGQTDDGELTYCFDAFGEPVIDTSLLGYRLKSGTKIPSVGWEIVRNEKSSVNDKWLPVWGKRAVVPEQYNQLRIFLENKGTQSELNNLVMEFRVYNDGLAFRYCVPEGEGGAAESELTRYEFVKDPIAWFYNGENANYGPVRLSEVNATRSSNVTLQLTDSLFLNLHEAYLREGDPLRLVSRKGESSFGVASSPGVFGTLKKDFVSAWRVVLCGKTPGTLVDSHLIELLNPDPDSQMDFSWVKPGIAVWDWRINGATWDGFEYSMSYLSWMRMVDFAAEQGFKYLVLDANWYGPEFEQNSNPIEGDKASDVRRLITYGKEKGVGIWLYLNDVGGKKFPIEETLKQYGDWGAAGVKYGFMRGSMEEKNLWTQKVTRLCAQNHLLVNFHDGPVHPYGQMRTWPNAVTREFCHAQLDAHRVFTPSTFCTTVFVNMVAGPMDMNNGMFDLRQGNTTRVDENQPVPSTLVSEAARTLIVFSGVSILPDIPEYYRKYPALLNFLSAQKMPWKESCTLAGQIGEYIVMMRQTENAYLVAAATNESGRTIDLPLSFLKEGNYEVEVVEDGDDAHYLTNREAWKVSKKQISPKDTLKLKLAPGGGACLTFNLIITKPYI